MIWSHPHSPLFLLLLALGLVGLLVLAFFLVFIALDYAVNRNKALVTLPVKASDAVPAPAGARPQARPTGPTAARLAVRTGALPSLPLLFVPPRPPTPPIPRRARAGRRGLSSGSCQSEGPSIPIVPDDANGAAGDRP